MKSRSVLFAGLVGALAGFAGGWAASATSSAPAVAARNDVAGEVTRLSSKIDRLEAAVRAMADRPPSPPPAGAAPTEPPAAAATPSARGAGEPAIDPYATWSDEEVALVAITKGDDLNLFKAALRRPLSAERRVKVLLALARFDERLDKWGRAQCDALSEAAGLLPPSTVLGAQAALEYAAVITHTPSEKWRGEGFFEGVLRDGPTEGLRMKGAYGLAWRHDFGDEPDVALAEFNKFLAEYSEKWNGTTEVDWAKTRVYELSLKR